MRPSPRPASQVPTPFERSAISPAEHRVLALMLHGHSNGTIAETLALSRRTVEGHVSMLLRKTGCHSRTQLVLWALGQR
ncbi:MAG: helix-turn-helix transcriptional regulator [Cyanobacteria bacterium K_Offshore_surface_m2_239]|nr:helix-turn-helix transcriptional regulator [Cyanobacteria bacterium K_Offshore_surface_m2_239]